jgi:hypothetical protein
VALRKTDRGDWIGFYDPSGLNKKTALRRGDSFEDYDLTGFEMHFSPNMYRYRDLAAFRNRRFHMMRSDL